MIGMHITYVVYIIKYLHSFNKLVRKSTYTYALPNTNAQPREFNVGLLMPEN